jgi:DNA-nicking Smr family endonuclease
MKGQSLAELGALRQALQARERNTLALRDGESLALRDRQALAVREREPSLREGAAHESGPGLFAEAVAAVTPLRPNGRRHAIGARPPPEPLQRRRDEQAALRESLSDEVDVESLLLTDDGLSFRRARVGHDVLARLRRGHWAIQAEIDLHGLRRDEARDALAAFVTAAVRRGQRCLRVVHGKGHGSPGREPVLKSRVQRWLAQCAEVIAYTQASAPQGGSGAVLVLLAGRPG